MKSADNRRQMSPRRFATSFHRWGVGLAILGWFCAVVAAQPAAKGPVSSPIAQEPAVPSPDEPWETQTVRELLQQDLQEAVHAASGRDGVTAGLKPTVRPLMAPRLVALYGVGRALMAEVQVGQKAYLYVRGQPFPAGHTGDSGVYQLRGMNGACVQLERGEDRHSLCLRMLLGEGQP